MSDRIRPVELDPPGEQPPAVPAGNGLAPGEARLPRPPWARVLGRLGALLLRLQQATWRTRVEGLDEFDRLLAAGETVLLVFWHGKYLPLFPILRGREACVFTSRSFRGAVLCEVGRHFGFEGVQLSDEGDARSFVRMRRALMVRRAGAIAVDGPLGPDHVVKPGVIELASRSGCALVPASSASRHKWVEARRWDRMERPLPFTRVALVLGGPLRVPRELPHREVAGWAERLAKALEAADRRARELT